MKAEIEKLLSPFPIKVWAQVSDLSITANNRNSVMYINFRNDYYKIPVSKLIAEKMNYDGSIGYGQSYIDITEDYISIYEKIFTKGESPVDLSIFNTMNDFFCNRKSNEKSTDYSKHYTIDVNNVDELEEIINKLISILSGSKDTTK